jgi:hypothetical protein
VTKDVQVTTNTVSYVKKTGTRMETKCVPVTKDVQVTTMTSAWVKKTGTRNETKCVPVTKEIEVTEYVQSTVTEKVMVPAASTSNSGMTATAATSGCGTTAAACGSTCAAPAACDPCSKAPGLFAKIIAEKKAFFGKLFAPRCKTSCGGCN